MGIDPRSLISFIYATFGVYPGGTAEKEEGSINHYRHNNMGQFPRKLPHG